MNHSIGILHTAINTILRAKPKTRVGAPAIEDGEQHRTMHTRFKNSTNVTQIVYDRFKNNLIRFKKAAKSICKKGPEIWLKQRAVQKTRDFGLHATRANLETEL